jgi:hypothetical protein
MVGALMNLSTSEQSQPVFRYSIKRKIVGWAIASPIVTGLYVYALFLEPRGVTDIYVLIIGLIPEIELFQFWRRPIWIANFYEDHAEVRGRKTATEFRYSDILNVVHRKSALGSVSLTIRLKGESKPLALHGNPTNGSLQIDLGGWLRTKSSNQVDSNSP